MLLSVFIIHFRVLSLCVGNIHFLRITDNNRKNILETLKDRDKRFTFFKEIISRNIGPITIFSVSP